MPANVYEPRPAATGDRFAASLRGFGPLGLVAIVVVLLGNALFTPLSAILALLWARLARIPLSELGFVRPQRWVATVLGGVAFGAALKLVMKSVVMPLFGADPVNQAFHYLAANTAALPWVLYAVTVGAGFGEETIFRGFAFERLRRLLGTSAAATVVIVVFIAVWFGAEHYSLQGLAGVQQATVVGLIFGAVFAATRRLPMLIIAHAAFDIVAVALIYWELETAVARAFFR
jgi:membrane protease YdiL (CAAX protease family)